MDITSYLLGKKAGGGGGSSDLDWSALGYSEPPKTITDGYNHAKYIYDNWDSTQTSLDYKFQNDLDLFYAPLVDTSNVTSMRSLFIGCSNLVYVPSLNTKNVSDMRSVFSGCSFLRDIEILNAESATSLISIFSSVTNLVNFGGLKDIGKSFNTTKAENYNYYTIDLSYCPKLTHDSLMNVINNLYDIKTKGCANQKLNIGATNLAKLSAEEIAIATNKGWNVL